MPRGGRREGAGGKPSWKHGKTKTIRVPVALSDCIMEFARQIDETGIIEPETDSKVLDLSGVSIRRLGSDACVLLKDLILKGYQIFPNTLADRIIDDLYKSQINKANNRF